MNLPDSGTPTRTVFPLLVAGKVAEGVTVQAEVTETALLPWGLALGNIKQTRKKTHEKWPPWSSIISPLRPIHHHRGVLTLTLLCLLLAELWLDGWAVIGRRERAEARKVQGCFHARGAVKCPNCWSWQKRVDLETVRGEIGWSRDSGVCSHEDCFFFFSFFSFRLKSNTKSDKEEKTGQRRLVLCAGR